MRPVWLIEAGVYGAEAEPLQAEIRRQGLTCAVVPHSAIRKDHPLVVAGRPLGPDDCAIGYGTYPFAREIQVHRRWTPGAWCHTENLDCLSYYAHFGRFLLNQNHVVMPGVEAIRQRDGLFATLGVDDAVFVRPTGCHKLFVARCIGRDDFPRILSPTRYDPTTLVIVASPRPIAREWRLVVTGNRIVAASQYARDGTRAIAPGAPAEVRDFAAAMLAEVPWRPDPIFMLDLCESAGRLWLVELNSFSGSWLYHCDLADVVEAASELASRQWAERPHQPPRA